MDLFTTQEMVRLLNVLVWFISADVPSEIRILQCLCN